jgi:hypothetical protein
MIFRQGPVFIDKVELLDEDGRDTRAFRFWGRLCIRVWYHCEGDIPEDSLGIALAVSRGGDMLTACNCTTSNVKLDSEAPGYHQASFRVRAGRHGFIEARIEPLQLNVGDYILSVGILGNVPLNVNFYELHQYYYSFCVLRGGMAFNGIHYPMVKWDHRPGAVPAAQAKCA